MKLRATLSLIVVAFAGSVGGCGGGGGGGSASPAPSGPVASTALFPPDAAVSTWVQAPHSFTLNATDASNNSYSFTYSTTPGAASTFEGSAAQTRSASAVLKKNGVTISTASSTDYFQASPFKALGQVLSTGDYIVDTFTTPLPLTASVGQTGAFSIATEYTSSSKTTVTYNSTTTWSLEPDAASTAWFCVNETIVYVNATPNYTEADCYKVDPPGNVLAYKATISQAGTTLVFQ